MAGRKERKSLKKETNTFNKGFTPNLEKQKRIEKEERKR